MRARFLATAFVAATVIAPLAARAADPPAPAPTPSPAPAGAPAPAPAGDGALAPAFAADSPPASTPATTASVQTAPAEPARPDIGRILVGARFGGVFPEAFNKLQASFLPEIEVAWQLPVPSIDRRLGLFLDVGYTQPTVTNTRTDPRVTANCGAGACMETYTVTARDLGFSLGVHYWHPLPKNFLVYGGLGGRMHLVRTISEAMAGTTPLGVNTEDSTKFGFIGRLGGAYKVGPGAIVLETHLEYTGIDHLITGGERTGESANIGNLALQAGYMFFIL